MTKKIFFCFVIFVLFSSLYAQEFVQKEESPKLFSASSNLTFVNNYYWRGTYLYPDGVPAFQPEIYLTYEKIPLTLNVWTSIPLKKRQELDLVKDEVDFLLSSDINLTKNTKMTLCFEVDIYPFASVFSHTEELSASFLSEFPYGFALEWGAYYDFVQSKGIYLVLSPTYQTAVAQGLDLKFKTLFGYTNYVASGPMLVELGFKTILAWQFSDYASLTTSVLYNYNYSASRSLYELTLGLGVGI